MPARPLTLQDLKSDLWNCAQILRGSAIDRTDWKGYILPLLFFKRISDVWDEETTEARAEYGDIDLAVFPELHRFTLPSGCHWRDVRETPANVGAALARAMRAIERANPDTLMGVFGAADWGNREMLGDELLKELIEGLSGVPPISGKVALGLETGDASLVRDRITATQVHAFLGAPGIDHTDGLDRLREQVDAPAVPAAVRERGREVLARLVGLAPTESRACARARVRVFAVLDEPALDEAHGRAVGSGARQGDPRRRACRTRRSEGAPGRLHRGASGEARRTAAATLPRGPAE